MLEARIRAREFLIPYRMLIIAEYYPLTKYYCKKLSLRKYKFPTLSLLGLLWNYTLSTR